MSTLQPTRSLPENLRGIEQKLKEIDGVRHPSSESFQVYDIPSDDFPGWYSYTRSLKNHDRLRAALYYGFQPLYDALVADQERSFFSLPSSLDRPTALRVLDKIVSVSAQYLSTYYQGKADPSIVSRELGTLKTLANVSYTKKERNIDRNKIYPSEIHSFLTRYLTAVLDGRIDAPLYIVGAACGSSEVALALAGLLDIQAGFMRMSKRREDRSVKVIREHAAVIEAALREKPVTCIEDYVCTRKSLQAVMEQTRKYNPSSLVGASVRDSREGNYLSPIIRITGFHTFALE